MTFIEKLAEDIADSVTEKLSGVSRRKKRSNTFSAKDAVSYAGSSSKYVAGAVAADMIKDIKSNSIDTIKNKLYALIDSAASRIMRA